MKKINFISLGTLIKSSMILLLMFSFSMFTVAQKVPAVESANPVITNSDTKAPAGSVVLYSQTDLNSSGWASQDFEASYDIYDCQGSDDFIVPEGGWDITDIDVYGSGSPGSFNLVNVMFYNDAGSKPDATAFASFLGVAATDNSGNLSITLPSGGISLTAGHYWMAVQDASPFATAGQWFWTRNNVVHNTTAHWRNPNNGFGTGATTWTSVDVAFGENNDLAFVLYGPQPIPVSSWAIYLGIFLIVAFVVVRYRKRRLA